jgi:hypothetical protein
MLPIATRGSPKAFLNRSLARPMAGALYMRGLLLVPFLASLAGCSALMPKPDPEQAWVDLNPNGETQLQAVAVDGKTLEDDRYFQVPPGSRKLEMRYRFEVNGANVGPGSSALARDCKLTLEYDKFTAGARYRLVAGGYGFRPWAKLYDQHQYVLARAEEKGCGDLAGR